MAGRIVVAKNSRTYETRYRFEIDGQRLPFGPEFDAQGPAKNFFYSARQIQLDILLSIFETFEMDIGGVTTADGQFIVDVRNSTPVYVDVVMIKSSDQIMTNTILGMGAALQQWVDLTPAISSSLAKKHVAFLVRNLPSDFPTEDLLEELRQVVASKWLQHMKEFGRFIPLPEAYTHLSEAGVKIMVSDGLGPSIQVTRGGLAVPAPHITGLQVQNAAGGLFRELSRRTISGRRAWAVFWFQSMYELFSVESIDIDAIATSSESSISRLFIGDGSKILEVAFEG